MNLYIKQIHVILKNCHAQSRVVNATFWKLIESLSIELPVRVIYDCPDSPYSPISFKHDLMIRPEVGMIVHPYSNNNKHCQDQESQQILQLKCTSVL
jgi:hypothetical protein